MLPALKPVVYICILHTSTVTMLLRGNVLPKNQLALIFSTFIGYRTTSFILSDCIDFIYLLYNQNINYFLLFNYIVELIILKIRFKATFG